MGILTEKKIIFHAHADTHTLSFLEKLVLLLNRDMEKDASLNRFGFFLEEGERGTRDRQVLTSGEW